MCRSLLLSSEHGCQPASARDENPLEENTLFIYVRFLNLEDKKKTNLISDFIVYL